MNHATDLIATLDRLAQPRVLVLGDLILDRYTFGDAERVSQEAPVILLRADRREARLGGAANVCNMLAGLEAHVTCAGVVGDDEAASEMRRLLSAAQIDCAAVLTDPTRPTTVKERFIGRAQGRHPHQILRVDNELRDALPERLSNELADGLLARIGQHDVVLISDYDKGVCSPALLRAVIDAARAAGIPVVADPIRHHDYSRYRGATTMTPNRLEAELATGIKITSTDDAVQAGWKLCRDHRLDFAIVTLDRDGMALVYPDGQGEVFATQPRAVYDITGAGDMVLSTVGLCLAGGIAPEEAVQLGNVAGGLEVEKVGVVAIPREEIRQRLLAQRFKQADKLITADELVAAADVYRSQGRRVVFTNGCFDLLHAGHVGFLQQASRLGDVLVVALNSDEGVRRLKGPRRPVIGQHDRAALMAALACVDHVVVFDDDTPEGLLRGVRPDVLVKGGNYATGQVVGREIVEAHGGRVVVMPTVYGLSTTAILGAIDGDEADGSPATNSVSDKAA